MRDFINIVSENTMIIPVLYHGTCSHSAENLIKNGWTPRSWAQGANMGQSRYLYLSSDSDDALWFAEEKGCNTVVQVKNVPTDLLRVDPEDGIGSSVIDELNNPHGLPGKVVLISALGPEYFSIHEN